MIFWKHVGQIIVEPVCDESHLMCWPQIGQAYLNSLIQPARFHIWVWAATRIFVPALPSHAFPGRNFSGWLYTRARDRPGNPPLKYLGIRAQLWF
jgi:hypothetical protein